MIVGLIRNGIYTTLQDILKVLSEFTEPVYAIVLLDIKEANRLYIELCNHGGYPTILMNSLIGLYGLSGKDWGMLELTKLTDKIIFITDKPETDRTYKRFMALMSMFDEGRAVTVTPGSDQISLDATESKSEGGYSKDSLYTREYTKVSQNSFSTDEEIKEEVVGSDKMPDMW